MQPAFEERKNDPFDRQRCLEGWNQDLVEQQVAFVLGVGGLGCGVAFTLARLGIKKMILLDYDVVDMTNLNRQILFSKADVGRRKVDAAADGIRAHIVGNTEVVTMHCNVLTNWGEVVRVARECTVLFNNIDIGGYFDYACLSLAKALRIPYSAGSSYGRSWIVEYFNAQVGVSSFSYENKSGNPAIFAKLHPSLICSYPALDFVERDSNPPTRAIGSSILVCGAASLSTVSAWLYNKFGLDMPNFSKVDITQYWQPDGIIAWPAPVDEDEIKPKTPSTTTTTTSSSS
ncbi:ThiF family protein [Pelomyxa schiedti]|nr:ThiF family protein [Pelomyxa schiedti]